jgi:two-component sensor histidine kinase
VPFFRPLTLRQGLIWVVFAALLPLMVIGALQGFSTFYTTQKLVTDRLVTKAKAVAERQRDSFVITQHLLNTLGANPEVASMSPGCESALSSGLRSYSPMVNLVRSDAQGYVRCSVLPYTPGTNFAKQTWWQRGIAANNLTISSPTRSQISKKNVLIMMLSLRERDGAQNGALTAGIDIAKIQRKLAEAPEAKAGAVAIITSGGQLVAHAGSAITFRPAIPPVPDRVLTGFATDGAEWMYVLTRLYSSDLFVMYAEPRDTLMAAAVAQVRASILLPLISILLASLAIWLGTNRLVVRWLRDLGEVANKFASGNFRGDQARFANAPHEIAELSANLHSMAEVIDKRNKDLTEALQAKTALTREVHHRVKNNLQIITSLLTLQAGRLNNRVAKDVLAQTRSRISALALIHRLLYEQDNGNEQGEVAINVMIGELCSQLRASHRAVRGVEFSCQASDQPVLLDHAVPLALFVVEAVTNAFRHAFEESKAGLIRLEFDRDGDDAVLTISDNGKGYPATQEPGQMGTELMRGFASQVDGQLSIDSRLGGGTRVTLRFPLRSTDPE